MDYSNIDMGRPGMVVTPTQNELTGEYGELQVSSNEVLANEFKFQDLHKTMM